VSNRRPERAEWARRDVYATSSNFSAGDDLLTQELTYETRVAWVYIITPGDNTYLLISREDSTDTTIRALRPATADTHVIEPRSDFDNPVAVLGSGKTLVVQPVNDGDYTVYINLTLYEHVSW